MSIEELSFVLNVTDDIQKYSVKYTHFTIFQHIRNYFILQCYNFKKIHNNYNLVRNVSYLYYINFPFICMYQIKIKTLFSLSETLNSCI